MKGSDASRFGRVPRYSPAYDTSSVNPGAAGLEAIGSPAKKRPRTESLFQQTTETGPLSKKVHLGDEMGTPSALDYVFQLLVRLSSVDEWRVY
jgi:hypothetical protein